MREFDPSNVRYGGITSPISAPDLRRFREWSKTAPFPFPKRTLPLLGSIARLLFDILVWLMLLTIPFAIVYVGSIPRIADGTPIPPWLSVTLVVVGIGLAGLLTWWFIRDIQRNVHLARPWKKWLRLSRFAHDNGFYFLPRSSKPPLSGTIFDSPLPRHATDRLVSASGGRLELGNYHYGKGDGSSRTQVWGYLAIGLHRTLPHMVLRAKANRRGKHGLPGVIAKDQILSLEGDFNSHFTLYAPRAYERDALYVFAPDLMALMIDEVAAYEVEVVDDWILFYSPKPLDLQSRRTLRRLFRIVRIVGAKTFRQTDRYWDDRAGGTFDDDQVAVPGRRLRTRVAIGATILGVIWIIAQVLRLIHTFQ